MLFLSASPFPLQQFRFRTWLMRRVYRLPPEKEQTIIEIVDQCLNAAPNFAVVDRDELRYERRRWLKLLAIVACPPLLVGVAVLWSSATMDFAIFIAVNVVFAFLCLFGLMGAFPTVRGTEARYRVDRASMDIAKVLVGIPPGRTR